MGKFSRTGLLCFIGAIVTGVGFIALAVMFALSFVFAGRTVSPGLDLGSYNVVKMTVRGSDGLRIAGTQTGDVFAFTEEGEIVWDVGALSDKAVYDIALSGDNIYIVYADGKICVFPEAEAREFSAAGAQGAFTGASTYSIGYNINGNVSNTQILVGEDGAFYVRAVVQDLRRVNRLYGFAPGESDPNEIAKEASPIGGMAVYGDLLYFSVGEKLFYLPGGDRTEYAVLDEPIGAVSVSRDELSVITQSSSLKVFDRASAAEKETVGLGISLDTSYIYSVGENFLAKIKNGGVALIDVASRSVTLRMAAGDKANFVLWTDDCFMLRDTSDLTNPVVIFYSVSHARSVALWSALEWVFGVLAVLFLYNTGVPVTEPITVEFERGADTMLWLDLVVMNNKLSADFFSNETGVEYGAMIQSLFFYQTQTDIQKLQGYQQTASTNSDYPKLKSKYITVEIYIPKNDGSDVGYVRANGQLIGNLAVTQDDFPDGLAYIGIFFANQVENHTFTVNTHLNPVALTAPNDDSKFKMDLAEPADFTVDLINTSGKLKITDETGAELQPTDYTYASGKLTFKADYFAKKLFTKEGVFKIWDTEKQTGTKFNMAYENNRRAKANVAFVPIGSANDVVFDLGISAITALTQNDTPVPEANYSFADGKLTFKASVLPAQTEILEYLCLGGDGTVYPLYIFVGSYADGVAKTDSVAYADGTYTLTGEGNYQQAKLYDLTNGVTFAIDFAKIGGWYENEKNSSFTNVAFRIYDPFTGYTLNLRLMANFSDDNITMTDTALFLSYNITDRNGGRVEVGQERILDISKNPNNTSANGLQCIQLKKSDTGLSMTICGREYTIRTANLHEFNIDACTISVVTENTTSDSVVKITEHEGIVNIYGTTPGGDDNPGGNTPGGNTPGGDDNPGGTTPGGDDNPGGTTPGGNTPSENAGGCGGCGTIGFGGGFGGGIGLGILACAAILVVALRKKNAK